MSKQIIVVVAALAIVACGGSGSGTQQTKQTGQAAPQGGQAAPQTASSAQAPGAQPAAQSAQQTTQSAAQAGQQFAQGLAQMAQALGQKDAAGKPVLSVDFEKLEALLPSPGGWTKGKSIGRQMTTIVSTSNAGVSYTKGEMGVHLEITDSAASQLLLAPLSMMLATGYSERSSSGYKKSMTMGGSPGYEEWDSDDKTGEVTVLVNNRFIVAGKGSHLDSIETLRAIVSQVDFGKLAALK